MEVEPYYLAQGSNIPVCIDFKFSYLTLYTLVKYDGFLCTDLSLLRAFVYINLHYSAVEKECCYRVYFKVFLERFFSYLSFGIMQKLKALQIWSNQCCRCSDQCCVRVYSCPVVFHKRDKPVISLVSLPHKHPANKWIHVFIAHPQKNL